MQLRCKKKICMEKVLWLIKQKWFGKFHAGDSSLEIYPFTVGVEVDSNQTETLIEVILCHKGDSQYTQNIQIKWWKSFAPAWSC